SSLMIPLAVCPEIGFRRDSSSAGRRFDLSTALAEQLLAFPGMRLIARGVGNLPKTEIISVHVAAACDPGKTAGPQRGGGGRTGIAQNTSRRTPLRRAEKSAGRQKLAIQERLYIMVRPAC